jgi:uncharacterized protein (DUF1330 family)
MKVYLVAEISVRDPALFAQYLAKMPAFVGKYGGRYLVKGESPAVIEGKWSPDKLVIVEFPEQQKLTGFLSDEEVKSLFSIRRLSTESSLLSVSGCD